MVGSCSKKKLSEIPLPTALSGISRARFNLGSRNFYTFVKNNWPHKPAGNDATSRFQSVAKCYLRLHKSVQNRSGRTKCQIIRPMFNLQSQKLAGTSVPTCLKPYPIGRQQLLLVVIYQASKNGRKCRIPRLCLH